MVDFRFKKILFVVLNVNIYLVEVICVIYCVGGDEWLGWIICVFDLGKGLYWIMLN